MTRILILGYGNPLRADDGLGWVIATRLQHELTSPGITILTDHQLTPELAEALSQVDHAILVDAGATGEPGTIETRDVAMAGSIHSSNHFSDAGELLRMAHDWYGHAPRMTMVTAPGYSFDYAEALSEDMQKLVPRVLETVRSLLPPASTA